jgi:hypothetical protein
VAGMDKEIGNEQRQDGCDYILHRPFHGGFGE